MRAGSFQQPGGPRLKFFLQAALLHLNGLDADTALRVVFQTGGDGDAVVGGALEVAPVVVGDGLHGGHLIGAGAVHGGVGDGVAGCQILDCPDVILGAPVVVE